jgi:hypothetical protein
MSTKKLFPTICPSCGEELHVHALHCAACDTTISSDYRIPALLRLAPEQQRFVAEFIKCSGSLKEMSVQMGLSYPTVRNLLDAIIENLKNLESYEENL